MQLEEIKSLLTREELDSLKFRKGNKGDLDFQAFNVENKFVSGSGMSHQPDAVEVVYENNKGVAKIVFDMFEQATPNLDAFFNVGEINDQEHILQEIPGIRALADREGSFLFKGELVKLLKEAVKELRGAKNAAVVPSSWNMEVKAQILFSSTSVPNYQIVHDKVSNLLSRESLDFGDVTADIWVSDINFK